MDSFIYANFGRVCGQNRLVHKTGQISKYRSMFLKIEPKRSGFHKKNVSF